MKTTYYIVLFENINKSGKHTEYKTLKAAFSAFYMAINENKYINIILGKCERDHAGSVSGCILQYKNNVFSLSSGFTEYGKKKNAHYITRFYNYLLALYKNKLENMAVYQYAADVLPELSAFIDEIKNNAILPENYKNNILKLVKEY